MTKNSKKTTEETKKKKTGFQNFPENINRNGRPKKGMAITDIMREYLEEVEKGDKTRKEILIEKIYEMASQKDLAALKYIIDRLDGKPKERHDIGLDQDTDIKIKIEWE